MMVLAFKTDGNHRYRWTKNTRSPESVLSAKNRNSPAALARKTSAPVVFGAVEGTYPQMPFDNVDVQYQVNVTADAPFACDEVEAPDERRPERGLAASRLS